MDNCLKRWYNGDKWWDYYNLFGNSIDDLFQYPYQNIQKFFNKANKANLCLENDKISGALSQGRAAHSISSFILGAILAEKLIKNKDAFCKVQKERFPFSYVWALTSFFHDYGYIYENSKVIKDIIRNINGEYEAFLKNELKIDNSIFNKIEIKELLNNEEKNKINAMKCIGIKTPMRDLEVIFNYLRYIANKFMHIDHGIVGGMVFYDRIIKNYIDHFHSVEQNDNKSIYLFNHNGKRFSLEQIGVFKYISDCIINHNIWKAPINDIDEYKKAKLEQLINGNFEKVNFYKNPLLFILVMSDVLEPYKNFLGKDIDNQYKKEDVFDSYDNFKIAIDNIKKKIYITATSQIQGRVSEKLKNMEDWIDIKVECMSNGDNIINILK